MTANKKKTTLSRRNFLAQGGGALVPLFLDTGCSDNVTGPDVSDPTEPPPEPTPDPQAPEDRVDVIVVGAGLAGLVAAYELVRAGHDVRVVEARNAAGAGHRRFASPSTTDSSLKPARRVSRPIMI